MAVRRSRIDPERVARFANDLRALPNRIEPAHAPAAWDAVIKVATEYRLTVYDAVYLELAQEGSSARHSGRGFAKSGAGCKCVPRRDLRAQPMIPSSETVRQAPAMKTVSPDVGE